ncbi:MAG: response regulator transcription factor [Myxococcales bacterium]|nr:response regulator transcription factor [Myxococcales bacterium]MDH5308223.1 response regulator transcription factor [Myxococcales bacterium]MDH5565516.1 response regulator transcription factor [Myxococcales bacterium]
MPLALLVEDDQDTRAFIRRALSPALSVVECDSVAAAERFLASDVPDVIVLDVGLPDASGHELAARLQADPRTRDVPVLFLSASVEIRDKLAAFSLGAEDYIEKPVDPAELRARVQARIARSQGRREAPEIFEKVGLRFDVAQYRAFRTDARGSLDLELTPHEFRLLYHLARHENQVLSRGQLLRAAWGDTIVTERTVDAHMAHLRRKLGSVPCSIESVRGLGYRFLSQKANAAD